MNIDQLAKALYYEQIKYYIKIRRYDPDYDITYEQISPEAKDAFKNYAAWIITHKSEIFPKEKIDGVQRSTGQQETRTV